MNYLILMPIILAFILGAVTNVFKDKSDKDISRYALISTIVVSITSFIAMYLCYGKEVILISINDLLSLGFKIDGLGLVFAALVSFLWPLATLYATKYMTHEGKLAKFFTFYTMTFGTVLAIAFSKNMFTMYLFFETLTFITFPLVTHNNKARDVYAGKNYILYSVGGASISFMGMMMFMFYTNTWEFAQGGSIASLASPNLLVAYLLMFVGFSVKAGIFPFHRWLISAGVAPTPVTALLHAVAVVKSGAFAVMRVTYYLYSAELLKGTWVSYVAMAMCIITIVFGSATAMRSKHLKRRFAYSTVSQLSYILLATATMSYIGLVAACMHMIFHALIKIVIFYSAGNVMYVNHSEYVCDIEGYGKIMKSTYITFAISGLALIGIPPFGGFFSKFAIAQSAISVGGEISLIAVSALIISALFTAMYLLQIVVLAFLPHDDFDYTRLQNVKPVPFEMKATVYALTATMIVMSLSANGIYNFLQTVLVGGVG
ncbi:MAG: complex I subunit 5 family protein [Clostridium sp.]